MEFLFRFTLSPGHQLSEVLPCEDPKSQEKSMEALALEACAHDENLKRLKKKKKTLTMALLKVFL